MGDPETIHLDVLRAVRGSGMSESFERVVGDSYIGPDTGYGKLWPCLDCVVRGHHS